MPTEDRLASDARQEQARDQIVEIQRARILEAMTEIVADRGLYGTTIAAVAKRACVSRVTFAEVFGSVERAFVSLVEQATALPANLVREAFESKKSWSESVLSSLEAFLVFLDSEPAIARVCLIDALAGPPAALEHRARLLEPLTVLLDEARDAIPAHRQPPAITAEAVVAAVAGVLHARLVAYQAPPFIALLGELTELVIAPYFGVGEASKLACTAEERARAIARERSTRPPDRRVPVPRQLHHARASRARACVLYVAEHPGASNQTIASGIGIRHLGQASTLLARLEGLEVLIKHAGGAGRRNAWTLSAHGQGIVRSLKGP